MQPISFLWQQSKFLVKIDSKQTYCRQRMPKCALYAAIVGDLQSILTFYIVCQSSIKHYFVKQRIFCNSIANNFVLIVSFFLSKMSVLSTSIKISLSINYLNSKRVKESFAAVCTDLLIIINLVLVAIGLVYL